MLRENYAKIGDLGCFKYYEPEEQPPDSEKKQGTDTAKNSEANSEPEQ